MSQTAKWLLYSIGGLVLVGAGVSIVGEAIILKAEGAAWFWPGTGGLVVLNAGISCFGQGVIERVRALRERAAG